MLALIDSGADENLLDASLVKQLGLKVKKLEKPLIASTLDGCPLANITTQTCPVQLLLSGNHREEISFFVLDSPHIPLVLGHSWLIKHNPHIDWSSAKIISWSLGCHASCLLSAQPLSVPSPSAQAVSPHLTSVPS